MKPHYSILNQAAIAFAAATSMTAFGESQPAGSLNNFKYQSPLEQAIELQNQMQARKRDTVLPSTAPEMRAAASCINGSVSFNSAKMTNGFTWQLNTGVRFVLGETRGNLTATGRYCWNGNWEANGYGGIKIKNEATAGLFYPPHGKGTYNDGWKYFDNDNYRFKLEFGLKGNADLSANAALLFRGRGFYYNYAKINFGAGGNFQIAFVSPQLTLQRKAWIGGAYTWVELPIHAPTNGDYVDNIAFELTAWGGLSLRGEYQWRTWDNDPDDTKDNEQQRFYGSITGQAGVKAKFKFLSGREFEQSIYWDKAYESGGATIDTGYRYVDVDDDTDAELNKRPR